MKDNSLSRRQFINHSTKTIVAASVVAQCGGLLAGCAQSTAAPAGSTITPDENGIVTLTFAEYPNLETNDGAYQVRVQISRALRIVNVHNASGTVKAFSATCPHQGNIVNKWNGTNFTCPAHGSKFDTAGNVTGGPATSNLTSFAISQTATGVEILVT